MPFFFLDTLKALEIGSMRLSQSSYQRSTLKGDGICQTRGTSSARHLTRVLPIAPPPAPPQALFLAGQESGPFGELLALLPAQPGEAAQGSLALPEVWADCLSSHLFHSWPHDGKSRLGRPVWPQGTLSYKAQPPGQGPPESELCLDHHANLGVNVRSLTQTRDITLQFAFLFCFVFICNVSFHETSLSFEKEIFLHIRDGS